MPVFYSHTGQLLIPANMSGVLLCACGNANLLINGNEINVSRGSICPVTPFRFIEIVSESDDCKWEMICDEKDVYHNVAKYALNAMKNSYSTNHSYNIDEKQIEKFMFFVNMIKDKQRMIDSNLNEENIVLLQHNITLLKQAAIVEFLTLYVLELSFIQSYKLSNNENVVLNFFKILAQNFPIHHDVAWYAEQANLSTVYFTNIIHQYTGYTPALMIKHIIVANAKMLLAQRELSIKEIATRLNFSNQFAFSRYFKSCTEMSPNEYRKTLG